MNPFRSNVGTLNEILFEKKNKNYGAYAIRMAYESTVLKSLSITASIILGGTWFLSILLGQEPEVKVPNYDIPLPPSITYSVDLSDPNKPKDQPKAKHDPPKTAASSIKKNIDRFVIKDKPVDSANIKIKDPVEGLTSNSVVTTAQLQPPTRGPAIVLQLLAEVTTTSLTNITKILLNVRVDYKNSGMQTCITRTKRAILEWKEKCL